MELYFMANGRKKYLDRVMEDLEDIYLPYTYLDKDGVKVKGSVQLVARPIRFYKLVFPEDQIHKVLPLLNDGYPQYKWVHKIKNQFCKLLGLKPLTKKQKSLLGKGYNSVGLNIIGLKKDNYKDGIEQL